MRTVVTFLVLLLGITLMVISYFFLAAPLGPTAGPEYSNPRLIGAPALFILGVMLVFIAAVIYELLPERRGM
jgi:uncharacterized BrkB/YihY/UPF0761 family membrane protein